METTAGAVGEPNSGGVLRAATAVTAFGPGGAHLDVFSRALLDDPPARVDPMTVRFQLGARAVWAKPRDFPIIRIPGDEYCWGDLLSSSVMQPGRAVCVHESVTYAEVLYAGSDKFPTAEVVRAIQAAAAEGGSTLDTSLGVSSLDSERLNRVEHHDHRVIWVPDGAESLKKRLLVCGHLEGTGHRGVHVTMPRIKRHCVWDCGKTLPHFAVGDYVLVDRVSRQGKRRKLMGPWPGP